VRPCIALSVGQLANCHMGNMEEKVECQLCHCHNKVSKIESLTYISFAILCFPGD
jgi:hypothetical protein